MKWMGEHTKEKNIVIAPEGHQDTRRLINGSHLKIVKASRFPNTDLTIAHLAEPSGGNIVFFAHPDDASTLRHETISATNMS